MFSKMFDAADVADDQQALCAQLSWDGVRLSWFVYPVADGVADDSRCLGMVDGRLGEVMARAGWVCTAKLAAEAWFVRADTTSNAAAA